MAIVIQRPLRGSRISTFYPVKSLPSLSSLDSAFQLQEYISLLIRLDVHDVDTIVSVPGKKDKSENEGEESKNDEKEVERERKSEIAVDEACWIYEQLRRLAQDLSHPLITMLQQECTRASCPEMKAGEWLYLCVAHGNDGAMEQCCAIDYILHTLDSATALLNSPRAFPSRLQIPQSSHRHFSSLARRLGRIFAHAYFHHREAFEQAEVESSLYARFLALTSKFDLVPSEFLVIPTARLNMSDGEGGRNDDVEPPRLLAASIDRQQQPQIQEPQPEQQRELEGENDAGEWSERAKSPPGLGGASPARDQSPRRYGRNRTDTMVFSEAFNVAEDLAKGDDQEGDGENRNASGDGDINRAGTGQDGLHADVVESTDGTTAEAVLEAPNSESKPPQQEPSAPVTESASPPEEAASVQPSTQLSSSNENKDAPEPPTQVILEDAPITTTSELTQLPDNSPSEPLSEGDHDSIHEPEDHGELVPDNEPTTDHIAPVETKPEAEAEAEADQAIPESLIILGAPQAELMVDMPPADTKPAVEEKPIETVLAPADLEKSNEDKTEELDLPIAEHEKSETATEAVPVVTPTPMEELAEAVPQSSTEEEKGSGSIP